MGRSCTAVDFERQQTEHVPRKYFICGSIHHLISKWPKPPKDNKKWQNNVRFNETGNNASYVSLLLKDW